MRLVAAMRSGWRGLAVAAFILAVALFLFFEFRGGESGKAANDPAQAQNAALPVPVTPVVKKTVPVYLEYIGTTDAIRMVSLQAQVTGYLQ